MFDFLVQRFGSNGFIGEQLWIGHTGHALIVMSFVAAALSTCSFFASEWSRTDDAKAQWIKLGRWAFAGSALAVFGIFVLLFIMILNHRFEYHYAWRHSSTSLPVYYIISSFWEGQEGSFLLWQFWIAVMGLAAIHSSGKWEAPVMGVVALTQFFLGSMVLGIYFFGWKAGSNPFTLLRIEMADAPVFAQKNYLELIKDGNGLNPLLQNYWMTIHPPVLFSGFAATLFPFAFGVASLLRGDYHSWVKPAIRWSLLATALLGTGILMGGAWAYESLSFGGFWAWDPVENMSLVPWLLLVVALHLLLVYKHTGHSIISSYVFLILQFSMVLYSTFLTRSGILGDTSVHAFTDLGMQGQLLIYFAFFSIAPFILLTIRYLKLPRQQPEEPLWSREFWMFIGGLLLFLSAAQMTFTTSIPVWNKLFGLELAPPADVVKHYNDFQIWVAVLVAILTGAIQFLSYKTERIPSTARWAAYAAAVTVLCSMLIALAAEIPFTAQHLIDLTAISDALYLRFTFLSTPYLFLFASLYAVVANAAFLFYVLKGKLKTAGASVAHFGFGVFLIGVILSQYKKEVISLNTSRIDFGKEFKADEKMANVLLLRDSVMKMGDYEVIYRGRKTEGPNTLYRVDYSRKDEAGAITEKFSLFPNAQLNPKMGLLANPDTKHYLTRDIFTHITSVPNNSQLKDTSSEYVVLPGDTFYTQNAFVVFRSPERVEEANGVLGVQGNCLVRTLDGDSFAVAPRFNIDIANGGAVFTTPATIEPLHFTIDLVNISPQTGKVTFRVTEKEKATDFIILKAVVFPYINLVWLGGIITFAGVMMAWWRRRESGKPTTA